MAIMYDHWSEVRRSTNVWPWKNFTPREIACRGTGELMVVPYAMDRLQSLRDIIGPIKLSSAYRSRLHNVRVGGAGRSAHRALFEGVLAFDIPEPNMARRSFIHLAATRAGFTGFGWYNTFLHIDTGRRRKWGSYPS